MAEIPPAGGPADVSSMLDAWLAEDQGAVAGDWSLVEPGTVPVPAEQPAGAAEALPAAVPLPDAADAGGVEADASGWAPVPEAASTGTDLQLEAAADATVPDTAAADVANADVVDAAPSADVASAGSAIEARATADRAVFGGAPEEHRDVCADERVPSFDVAAAPGEPAIEPPSGLAAGEEPVAASPPAEPSGTGNVPVAVAPPCDAWLAEEQTPAQDSWTTLEAGQVAVHPSLAAAVAAQNAPPVDAAAPVVEGTDSWFSEARGDEGSDWTSIEPSVSEAIAAAPLEIERAALPEAPDVDPLQAEPPAAGTGVPGIDAWLNDGQGVDSGWTSAEPAAVLAAAPPSVAPDAMPCVAADAAPPAVEAAVPSASLLEAVSALDARGGDVVEPETPPAGAEPQRAVQDRYVLFTVAGAQYAVQETFVTELDRVPKITTVPNVPAWVRGVTNRRGDILSVVEIRGLLGLERIAAANERMLVVRLLDESCSLGLLVDAVQQIVTVAADDIRPPAATLEGVLAPFLGGVFEFNGKAVAVLDLDRMLRSEPVRQFDEPPDADEG